MVGGELFVPKLPSMNIMDLAKAIAPECRYETVGIRAGEKLHEVMIPCDDARRTLDFGTYYVIQPDFRFFEHRFKNDGGRPVPADFEYNSGTNDRWLTVEDLQKMIMTL
jgi:UDP-N-acetylglucosamine 4,6-dehydratase